jgi:hypothetical protein
MTRKHRPVLEYALLPPYWSKRSGRLKLRVWRSGLLFWSRHMVVVGLT